MMVAPGLGGLPEQEQVLEMRALLVAMEVLYGPSSKPVAMLSLQRVGVDLFPG
jgi:hypothetical protein